MNSTHCAEHSVQYFFSNEKNNPLEIYMWIEYNVYKEYKEAMKIVVEVMEEYKYQKYKKIYSTLSAGILAMLASSFVAQTFIIIAIGNYKTDYGWFNIYLADVPMYCVAIWSFLFFMSKLPHRKPKREKFAISDYFSLLLIAFFVMMAGAIIGNIAHNIFKAVFHSDVSDALTETVSVMNIWEEILFLVVIAPLGEELVFRKLIIDRSWMYGELASIVFSAVCFGLYHGNVPQIVYTTMVGLVLGYLYVRSGSYLLCVIVHAVINLFFGIIYPYVYEMAKRENYLVNEIVTRVVIDSQWVLAFAGLVALVVSICKKNIYINSSSPVKPLDAVIGAFTNAPFAVYSFITGLFIFMSYVVSTST